MSEIPSTSPEKKEDNNKLAKNTLLAIWLYSSQISWVLSDDFYDNQINQFSSDLQDFKEYIEQENLNKDFRIKSWHIKLDPIWWFADWTYNLDKYKVNIKDWNFYSLELTFRKKRWALSYIHKENINIYYKANKLVINHNWKYYEFETSRKNKNFNFWDITLNIEFLQKRKPHWYKKHHRHHYR